MNIPQTTLCYIEKDNQYLMLLRNKKEHDLNENKWIGIGGHQEEHETIEDCLLREVKEETGLELVSFQKRGEIDFICDGYHERMHLFTSNAFTGTISDCNEGTLCWIDKAQVSSLPLWEGDHIFLEKLLNNDPFFHLTLEYQNNHLIRYMYQ